jgi:hypothetical protein
MVKIEIDDAILLVLVKRKPNPETDRRRGIRSADKHPRRNKNTKSINDGAKEFA